MNEPISTIAPAKDDADILAAWERMGAARSAIDALGDSDIDQDNALWDAFGLDEHVIQGITAATIAGAEIQLWCHLLHTVPSADDERAVLCRNLSRFIEREDEYDWTERLVFSAIRSLRALGGAE